MKNNIEEKIKEILNAHKKMSHPESGIYDCIQYSLELVRELTALLSPDVDVEKLRKEFEEKFDYLMPIEQNSHNLRITTREMFWNFFLPHPKPTSDSLSSLNKDLIVSINEPVVSNPEKIRKEALVEFLKELNYEHGKMLSVKPHSWTESNKVAERVYKKLIALKDSNKKEKE